MLPLDEERLDRFVEEACDGWEAVSAGPIISEARRNLYDGLSADELSLAPILAPRTLVEQKPNYAFVSARMLLDRLRWDPSCPCRPRERRGRATPMRPHVPG